MQLQSGKSSQAIHTLEELALQSSGALASRVDLSAAYLARFVAEQDPIDLLRSVAVADAGLALRPSEPALLFNRAMALTLLGARHEARRAWREVWIGPNDPQSGWRAEAGANLRALSMEDDRWPALYDAAESSSELAALAVRMPARARVFAEEVLLPGWAGAVARGDTDTAQRVLSQATDIAEALRLSRRDELLFDAVAALRRTMAQGSDRHRRDLIDGLRAFGIGVARYNEQNLASAEAPFKQAKKQLSAAGNPLRFWADFYLALGRQFGDSDGALVELEALLAEIPQRRYAALAGRTEWIAGTIHKVNGRIQTSVHCYERAGVALRRAGGAPASAFVSVLLAESYTLLGDHARSWQERLQAFRDVSSAEGPRRNIAMWIEAKEALLRQGELRLAGPLVDEAVAIARQWGRPVGLATAYPERAAYRLATGDREGAYDDLQSANRALAQMELGALRDQIGFSVAIGQGLWWRTVDPARAARLLEGALAGQATTGNRFEAITYTTAMADAKLAAGDIAGGTAALEQAVSLFEDIRSTVEDPVSRMQAFRQAQPAFDRLIDLHTAQDDPAAPFLLAERSRSRVLLDMRLGPRHRREFLSLADVEQALPNGVALVSYVALEHRLLVWVIEGRRSRLATLPAPRQALVQAIELFRDGIGRQAEERTLQGRASSLYDTLVRPLRLSPDVRSLVLVPDRWLARLPFPALFDRKQGRYLIEQWSISVAPSATLLLARAPQRVVRNRELAALVVGVDRGGVHRGRFLQPLRFAGEEARQVAALYPGATLLLGEASTPRNFLRAAVSKDVVHFAGHAIADLDSPRRSVLLFAGPAANTTAPVALGELFDVSMGDVSLVVLSACRGQDSLADDREGTFGLAGAFLAAGVPEVVASPWDVDDHSAGPVMAAFHRRYRETRSASDAFRQAVLDLRRHSSGDERSPASWGGFTVITAAFAQGGA